MLLTLKAVGKELDCSSETVRKLVNSGAIIGIRVGDRGVRVHPDDLNDYVNNQRIEAKLCQSVKTKQQDAGNHILKMHGVDSTMSRQKSISRRV